VEAIRRFLALELCLYQFLDSLRHRLERIHQRHVTLGETLAWLRQRHTDLALGWTYQIARLGVPLAQIQARLAPAILPLRMSNC